jgi:hypothetical protein
LADLTDVTAYLASAAASAVYPNGISQPSVASMDVRIFEGWPHADQLDLDLGGKMLAGRPPVPVPRPNGPAANVSVYPMMGSNVEPFQILDKTYVIVPPVFGMGLTVTGLPGNTALFPTVTVAGQPTAGEYLTLICDRQFVYSATGVSTASILAQIAAQAAANYTGVTSSGNQITIPAMFDFSARQGAPGTLANVTHRQRQEIMITTWAPNHVARSVIAAAIDVELKKKIVVALPDTSSALICYSRSSLTDEQSVATLYRRDLIYQVEYATLFKFTGYVITSTTLNIQAGNWAATSTPPVYPFQDRVGAPFPPPSTFLR